MDFYLKILAFIGFMAIIIPFVLFFANLVASPFLSIMHTSNSVYYNSANTVVATANNSLIYVVPVILLIVMAIGIVVDIWVAVKFPNIGVGIINIFGVFVLVALWLVLNNFIYNSQILAAFGYPNFLLYQMFASSYLITSLCAAMLISASFNLSGKPASRQP